MGYAKYGLTLSESQKKTIGQAIMNNDSAVIRLTVEQLTGDDMLALTSSQIKRIEKHKDANRGIDLKLSKTQLQNMKKQGGFLPLIPLILAGLSAVGGLAGGAAGIAKAVHDKQASDEAMAEQMRHNKEVEAQLKAGTGLQCCPKCKGSGLYLGKQRGGGGLFLSKND